MIRFGKTIFSSIFCLVTRVLISFALLTGAEYSCNFDNGLCSDWADVYHQDDFDWTNRRGSTPSYDTGPSSGHGGFGKYMYIETSSPRQFGDKAILEYSVPSNDVGRSYCLSFYYHMYGDTIHSLNVFNGGTKVFTKSASQGNLWLKTTISLTTLQNKIKFEGIRGTSHTGDIAIDDVSLVPGICKECRETLNQSFGRLDIRYTNAFDPYCNWLIGNGGIAQKSAVISIYQAYFGHSSEYVKVFGGNGTEVLSIDRWDLSSKKRFLEVSFSSSGNITIQASLIYSWSYIKIDYGIVNQGLDSARPLANWNLTVANKTTTSIRVVWNNPVNLFSSGESFLVAIAERLINVSSVTNGKLLPGNTTSSEITGLEIYAEYNIYVVIVDSSGSPFKSGVVVTMTDEGFPSRAPSGVRVTSVDYTTDLLVEWYPLSQTYANGKILGYTIYYIEYNDWYSSYKTLNTIGPYPTQFVLKGLKPAERYRVRVAAFTSKGRGPMSYSTYGTTGCSQTLREAFGEILYSTNSYYYLRCYLSIMSGGIHDAMAVLSVQEINLRNCSDYVKVTDGNGTDVLYRNGCNGQFAPEILFDVHFGSSDNISIQVFTSSSSSIIKIEYGILRQSLISAIAVSGWNISVSNLDSSGATLQWTSLDASINHQANFYIVEVKSMDGVPLDVHTVPGNTTTSVIKRLEPSSKYRVVVYGVDKDGQPYMSSQSSLSTPKVFCGTRPSSTRIVGGTVAIINSWPWQVMLLEYGRPFCGGSLVDPYWVITAAHCVQWKSPTNLKIRLGAHYRTSGSVGTEQDITISKIIVHKNYKTPKTYSNDIALLYLKKPAVLGVGVGLVCLPDVKNILPVDLNETCWITGWGYLYSGGYQPNTLMQASVPLVSKQRCASVYPGEIDDSMLCAGLDEGGIDTCQGDSGGPLVCEFNGTWHLEGITSWGYGCAQVKRYGVYAKVRALDSWVRANMYKVVPPSMIPPQNQSSVSLVWCSFDDGLCSEWSQSFSDDFDWTLGSGSTPSSSTGPSSGQGGSGNYLYIEASSPRKPGEKAQIVVTVPNKGKKACLSFYYHMYGASAGSLRVYNGNDKLFNVSGNQGNRWVIVEKSLHLNSTITFEGVRGSSYTGDIAIDQVLITDGNCPVSCSFDNGLCPWWSQSKSDVFDWSLGSGSTPSSGTGPSSDRSGTGYYMYIEATGQSYGDNAELMLSLNGNGELSCLKFYYHMYGATIGALNVYSENSLLFNATGNHGNYWFMAERTFYSKTTLTFEGIVGYSYTGDIAIDDLSITRGSCSGQTPPPTWYPVPTTLKPTSNPINSSIVTTVHTHKPSIPVQTVCSDTLDSKICFQLATVNGNFCTENFNLSIKYCPKSCGFCRDDCSDNPEHASICSLTARNKLCQSYQNWTMKHCRKACGYCTANRGISTSTHAVTFKPTTIPRTPSAKEMQKSVMLEMTNFDMKKWKEMEADFKQEVASAATRYCAGGGASCQKSLRRRRSSDSMEFSADMVHIVPGYPMQSPTDANITLLAFYLQLPGVVGDNLVGEDVLKNIVKSDMKSIEGSMGVTITTVQSMPSTEYLDEADEKHEEDDEKSTSTTVIVVVTLGALLLLAIIISVTLCIKTTRFGPKGRVQSSGNVNQGIDEGHEAVYEDPQKCGVNPNGPNVIA